MSDPDDWTEEEEEEWIRNTRKLYEEAYGSLWEESWLPAVLERLGIATVDALDGTRDCSSIKKPRRSGAK